MMLAERIERARRLLASVEKNYSPATLCSKFGTEDMVILDLIARDGLAIAISTIDTGRLPRATHELMVTVRKDYGLHIDVFAPWPETVDAYVEQYEMDVFHDHAERCLASRNVHESEPLRRALARKRGWVTAQRRDDSNAILAETALDPIHGIWQFSPLADWSHDDVRNYLRANNVPHHVQKTGPVPVSVPELERG